MKAIMLAAGEGIRCYPFTRLSPKIAQQVCGIPLLEYMLSWFGGTPEIEKLYIVVRNEAIVQTLENYLYERRPYVARIVDLFGQVGYKVEYINTDFEIEVIKGGGWGTGGDLRLAINQISPGRELKDDFLVCNADYVIARRLPDSKLSLQLGLSDIINYHEECKRTLSTVMTVALVPVKREVAVRFGVARLKEVKGFSLVRDFMEKPELDDIPQKPLVNAGVYVIDGNFILSGLDEFLPERPKTDLEKTLLERLAEDENPRLAAYLLDLEAWFDVGTLEQLIQINLYIAREGGLRQK